MTYEKELKERLDRLTNEIVQLKSILIYYRAEPQKLKVNGVWRDLTQASAEVSALWSGYSAVDEIRSQREGK